MVPVVLVLGLRGLYGPRGPRGLKGFLTLGVGKVCVEVLSMAARVKFD
jgi:hypothetical protein